jgi:hypothetical protein
VSESQKPNEREKNKRDDKNLIMLAKKSEIRDVRCNPDQVLIVPVYEVMLLSANDITSLPSVVSCLLQGCKDVFPDETPAGLRHCMALNIKSISL